MADNKDGIVIPGGDGPANFSLDELAKNIKGVKKQDGTELEVEAPDEDDKKEEDAETEDELRQDEEESSEEGDEEEGQDEDEEQSEGDDELQEVDSEEGEEESEEGDQEDNDEDSEESDEEIEGGDSEEEESETEDNPQEEFNVFEETDGVFETMDGLKEHAQLLKENPELLEMVNYYKSEGDLLPWLQATQVNVDSFSDIDVLREKFKSDNEELGLPADVLETIFEDDILSKYDTENEDENKAKVAKARLKREAAQARKEIKEAQQEFLLPTKRDVSEEEAAQAKENASKLESAKNKLSYQIRKEIKNGEVSVPIDDKGGFIKMKASPKVIDQMISTLQDVAIFQDSKGNFDIQKMAMVSNPKAFVSSVISSSEASGKKKFVDEKLKNRKTKGSKPGSEKSKNDKEKVVVGQGNWLKGAKIKKVN